MRLPNRPAVKILERLRTRRHVPKTSQPDKSAYIIQVPELTDDLHSERFLRFDKFPVEQIDQHIPLPQMQRVLPQLNDRAASLNRLRVRIFHPETLRRERNRRHQEFQRAQEEWMLTEKGFDEALRISDIPTEEKDSLPIKSYEVQKVVKKLIETHRPKNYQPFDTNRKLIKTVRETTVRVRGFRQAVIEIYDFRCAVCGLKIDSPDSLCWEVEAAHCASWLVWQRRFV
jgi:hypothetical protein